MGDVKKRRWSIFQLLQGTVEAKRELQKVVLEEFNIYQGRMIENKSGKK
jgi:hypothetical protein